MTSAVSRHAVERVGLGILRYGLVLLLVWIGGMRFTAYEAAAIRPLVESNPLMRPIYEVLSEQTART